MPVTGADALSSSPIGLDGRSGGGLRVDVAVTTDSVSGKPGRTRIAAAGVPLLGMSEPAEGNQPGLATATLGLTRGQALRLIRFETYARSIRLLPRPDG